MRERVRSEILLCQLEASRLPRTTRWMAGKSSSESCGVGSSEHIILRLIRNIFPRSFVVAGRGIWYALEKCLYVISASCAKSTFD